MSRVSVRRPCGACGAPAGKGLAAESAAVAKGLREKAEEFREGGGEIYRPA